MNAKILASFTMHQAVNQFLTDNAPKYSSNIAMQQVVTDYQTKVPLMIDGGKFLAIDKTPYSKSKADLKVELAEMLVKLSKMARVGLKKAKITVQKDQLSTTKSNYTHLADEDLFVTALANRDIMNAQIAVLSPLFVLQTEIDAMNQLAADFAAAKNTSEVVRKGTPTQRKGFIALVKEMDEMVKDLCMLAVRYDKADPIFYGQLIDTATPQAYGTHHTSVKVLITDQADGHLVTSAHAEISNSKKTGNSDSNGVVVLNEVRNGECTLKVQALGYKDVVKTIKIERGRENNFTVQLEKAA